MDASALITFYQEDGAFVTTTAEFSIEEFDYEANDRLLSILRNYSTISVLDEEASERIDVFELSRNLRADLTEAFRGLEYTNEVGTGTLYDGINNPRNHYVAVYVN